MYRQAMYRNSIVITVGYRFWRIWLFSGEMVQYETIGNTKGCFIRLKRLSLLKRKGVGGCVSQCSIVKPVQGVSNGCGCGSNMMLCANRLFFDPQLLKQKNYIFLCQRILRHARKIDRIIGDFCQIFSFVAARRPEGHVDA